ncbi:MAG: hypothetical protein K6L76_03840 [Agarilytica sp.]
MEDLSLNRTQNHCVDHKRPLRQAFGIITLMLGALLFSLVYYFNSISAIGAEVAKPEQKEVTTISLTKNENISNRTNKPEPISNLVSSQQHNIETHINTKPETSTKLITTNNTPLAQLPEASDSAFDVLPISDPQSDTGPQGDYANAALNPQQVKLDELLQQEDYDTEWAASVESETWGAFYNAGIEHSDITSIDCRSSICKIVFEHSDAHAQGDFQKVLTRHIQSHRGRIFMGQTAYGQPSTVVFRHR